MGMQWADFEVGRQLEPLIKEPVDKTQLVKYAGASGDYNLIHTDDETAKKVKLPGVIVHGMLGMGFLGQLVRHYAGPDGFVSKLEVRFGKMVMPGQELKCTAKVVAKDEAKQSVDLAIALEDQAGNPYTTGNATIQYNKRG